MAAHRPGRAPKKDPVPGPTALLEGYFRNDFGAGYPLPDFVQRTRDGASYDVFVCQVCSAMTPDPHAHAAWHRQNLKEHPSA